MCAFSILQKWPKIAKINPDDLLTLTMVSSESLGKLNQTLFYFSKIHYFRRNRALNDFNGSNATYMI